MSQKDYFLALDQGTTSTRALAISPQQEILATAQIPLEQHYPADGWVEHDAEEIWQASLSVLQSVTEAMSAKGRLPLALGITNQRETTVVFERGTGKPLWRAIVWQDRRTASTCETLRATPGTEAQIKRETGLLLDPYFSGTKLAWLLDDAEGPALRARSEAGEVLFGTIESYLTYRLTGGEAHVSDASNASRTLLLDVRKAAWSTTSLEVLNIPLRMLPEVVDTSGIVGRIAGGLPAAGTPIAGLVGDQQAAAIGQACISAGAVKSTYGTGCFLLQHTGDQLIYSDNRLLSTIASKIGGDIQYAVEGSIFNAGTVVQWMRDGAQLIEAATDSAAMAQSVEDTGGVYMVPAFTGLGAPHWRPDVRGLITGLTRDTSRAHLVRAGLESVAFQTADLMRALLADGAPAPDIVRIDGGMAANDWFASFLADMLAVTVERPISVETTAIGAALSAGVGVEYWPSLSEATAGWQQDRRFQPSLSASQRADYLAGWRAALGQCLHSG